MAAYDITEAEVQAIMPSYPTSMAPHITVSTLIVKEHLDGTVNTDAINKEINRWLAAHFAATMEALTTSEGAGKVQATYQRGEAGKGLESTQYGQNAIAMDASGKLKALSEGASATLLFKNVEEPWQKIS